MKSRQTNLCNNKSDASGFRLEEGGHIQAVAAERPGSVSQWHNSSNMLVTDGGTVPPLLKGTWRKWCERQLERDLLQGLAVIEQGKMAFN